MLSESFTCIHEELTIENQQEIDSFIEFLENSSGALRKKDTITVLHQAQRICGYVSQEVQKYIAQRLNVSLEEIQSAITFYDYFIKVPKEVHSGVLCQ